MTSSHDPATVSDAGGPGVRRVARDHVHAVLDRAVARPLTVITAARGYGKSSTVRSWAASRGIARLDVAEGDRDAGVLAARIVAALPATSRVSGAGTASDASATGAIAGLVELGVDGQARAIAAAVADPPVRLVLDDADRLAGSSAIDLLRALAALPGARVRLVVVSRVDLGLVDDVLRARGSVTEIDARHLAFSVGQIAEVLPGERPTHPRQLAASIADHTGGWPMLVDHLLDTPDELPAAWEADGTDLPAAPLAAARQALDEEEPAVRHVLAELALLGRTEPRELGRIRGLGPREAGVVLTDLVARGIARPVPGEPTYQGAHRIELAPVVRRAAIDVLLASAPDGQRAGVIAEVVDGLHASGELHRALRALADLAAHDVLRGLLLEHGHALVSAGHGADVAVAARAVPAHERDAALELLLGDALESTGDLEGARTHVELATGHPDPSETTHPGHSSEPTESGHSGPTHPGHSGPTHPGHSGPTKPGDDERRRALVLRLGRIDYLQGRFADALDRLAPLDPGTTASRTAAGDDTDGRWTATHAQGWLWAARSHLARGEPHEARRLAEHGLAYAEHHARHDVAAGAHEVLALVADDEADRRGFDHHHGRAFAAAERAGATDQVAWLRLHRAAHHLGEGRTTKAFFEVERALGAAPDTTGAAVVGARARCLRAEVLLRTGRTTEAAQDAATALEAFERAGSRRVAEALCRLGDVYRERGELALAEDAYRRALEVARPQHDRASLLAASVGLARVLGAHDLDRADEVAREAVSLAGPHRDAGAQLAAAWIGLARGEHERARAAGRDAHRIALARRDDRALAEVVTLQALLDRDPVPALHYAATRWHQLHDPTWAARTELAIARRSSRPDDRSRAFDLELRLARHGAAVHDGEIVHRLLTRFEDTAPVAVRTLGGLQLRAQGRPVVLADDDVEVRHLVVALVVAGRRSVAREELARLLWPDESPARGQRLLTDALDRLHRMLPDDGPAAIGRDATALQLRPGVVDSDLRAFEDAADQGLRAAREGRTREARALLEAARVTYRGELAAGEPDRAWIEQRRTELRERVAQVSRVLDMLSDDAGRTPVRG